MKKNILLYLSFLFPLAHAWSFELSAIKTDGVSSSVYRGKEMQKAVGANFDVSLFASHSSNEVRFSASITNKGDKDYLFEEGSITVWEGVYETGEWKKASYIPASVYLKAARNACEEEETLEAVSLGLSIAGAGVSTVTETTYLDRWGYGYTQTTRVYNPAAAAWEIALGYDELSRLKRNNREYLSYLEKNLLFTSTVKALESYSGFFVAEANRGPDYKVVFDFTEGERAEFYFTRSDKEEILHPWKDRTRERHAMTFGISPLGFRHYSFYYLWSRPRGVGMYTGFYFQKESGMRTAGEVYSGNLSYPSSYELNNLDRGRIGSPWNYEWKFDYEKKSMKYDAYGFAAGLTIKTVPYTWLLLGCAVEVADAYYYEGDLSYKMRGKAAYTRYGKEWIKQSKMNVLFTPQAGINFIANFLDVGAMVYFPIGGKITFDIMIGFAF